MFTSFVNALNAVQPRVWAAAQFVALLALVVYGGHLMKTGNTATGESLVVGSFALLKFEVTGKSQDQ